MAEDTAALLDRLGIQGADLIGWSDGGQLALRLAFTHPNLVRRIVVSGVGLGPKSGSTTPIAGWPEVFRREYAQVSPDGAQHWPVIFDKARAMWAKPTWGASEQELRKIQAPALVIAGDRDIVSVEQTARIVRSIPHAELCILPDTDHWTFRNRPDWLNPIILDFLDRD